MVYCHPAYLTYMQEYIMRHAGLDEAQAGINIARRNTPKAARGRCRQTDRQTRARRHTRGGREEEWRWDQTGTTEGVWTAPNPVEFRAAPPNCTVSLTSQRHGSFSAHCCVHVGRTLFSQKNVLGAPHSTFNEDPQRPRGQRICWNPKSGEGRE